MSTTPRAATARPVWVPVPFRVRARSAFAWLAASGVLAAASFLAGVWAGEDDTTGVVLAVTALICLTITAACTGLFLLHAAGARGCGDRMSAYGAGRRVEVTWASSARDRGRIEVEDVGQGEVVALERSGEDQPPHVTVGLGGHHLVLQSGPCASAPTWCSLVDDEGHTVARADAVARPGAGSTHVPADWTVRPARGSALRLRHRPDAPVPSHVTLLDELGTAWWVRDARLAELPDELDPASAVFVVLLVDHLRRSKLAAARAARS